MQSDKGGKGTSGVRRVFFFSIGGGHGVKYQKRIPPGDDPVLTSESNSIPGRGSSQVNLNVI